MRGIKKWTTLIAACGLTLPALAGEASTWALPGWDEATSPVIVDVVDNNVTVYLADPPIEADPPDPDLWLADPPDPDLGAGDPPTEADPPDPDLNAGDPPSERTGDPPTELTMHIVVDTASIGSLTFMDSEGRALELVYAR